MLFNTQESGATWAKVNEDKDAWIMLAPGQKKLSG
jgi:hypothetical protein